MSADEPTDAELAAEVAAAEAELAVAEAELSVARAARARARAQQARARADVATGGPTDEEPVPTEPLPPVEPVAPAEPALGEPAAEPAAPEQVAAEPTASEPTAAEPTVAEPTVAEPTAAEPTAAEPAASEPAASEPAVAGEPAARGRRRLGLPQSWVRARPIVVIASAVVAAAVVFAAVAGVVLLRAHGSGVVTNARARDVVLLTARQDIAVLNTLDYRSIDQGLASWLAASTGTLNDQLKGVSAADKTAIASSKDVTTAKILAGAVTDLDDAAGSATVIASVQVDVTPAGGTPTTKRDRLSATMTRVDSVWKISSLAQVGVTVK